MFARFKFSVLLFAFFVSFTGAAELKWKPVNINTGCVEFADLYKVYPQLEGSDTPDAIVRTLKRTQKNVRIIPLLDMSKDADLKKAGDSPLLKVLTKKNAYHISWGEGNFMNGILLYSEEVCEFMSTQAGG